MQPTEESQPLYHQTSKPPITSITIKHFMVTIVSLIVMIGGLYGLVGQIRLIFELYPKLATNSLQQSNSRFLEHQFLLYILFTSTTNFIATAYGLALIIKPSHLVKNAHFFVAFLILALTWYVNYYAHISPDYIIQTLP